MCTVSFISHNNRYFLTSNRDEHHSRPLALVPKEETVNGRKIAYPKDPKAGGSWFAISENGDVAVLLNGAYKKHIPTGNYQKSRGLVLLDIIKSEDPMGSMKKLELTQIEPFTVVLFSDGALVEFRWDGVQKHAKALETNKNYIWSSATLYNPDAIAHREGLFQKFIQKHTAFEFEDIINFHTNNNDDYENGFVIDRNTGLKTFSVTQAIVGTKVISLHHVDLINPKKHSITFTKNQVLNQLP